MTVLVEHDNGFRSQPGISEDNIATLDELPSLIQSYIQAGRKELNLSQLYFLRRNSSKKNFLTFSKNSDII